jgi:serine/threonine protein kinase
MSDTHNNNNDESKLISQGGYGCIYHPSFPVKTKKLDIRSSKKYVSKLQKNNYQSRFEEFIGSIIQKIPSYRYFFVPILKSYNIDLASISPESIQKCKAITKHMKEIEEDRRKDYGSKDGSPSLDRHSPSLDRHSSPSLDYKSLNNNFIIQKMEYISGSINLKKYLYKIISENTNTAMDDFEVDSEDDPDDHVKEQEQERNAIYSGGKNLKKTDHLRVSGRRHRELAESRHLHHHINKTASGNSNLSYKLISILFDCYERLSDCVNILVKNEIIHNDLKYNNVLIKTETVTPVIIDFGLSIYIKQLLENPWREAKETGEAVHSSSSSNSNPRSNNYYWKQHFYTHAPEYYLWPIESHIISFLIQESNVLSLEALTEIAYVYTHNNEAIMYMSSEFKEQYMKLCISIYGKYINRPREEIINELIKYWNKWDIYSQNVMFLKLFCSIVIRGNTAYTDKKYVYNGGKRRNQDQPANPQTTAANTTIPHTSSQSHTVVGGRNPHTTAAIPVPVYFETKQLQLNTYYFLDEPKIVDIIEFMLLNIHPDPEKRMHPDEVKTVFNSILYHC